MRVTAEEQLLQALRPKLRYVRFFKTRCEKCSTLVVHEVMWRYYVYDWFDGQRNSAYVCTDCAQTLDQVIDYARGRR